MSTDMPGGGHSQETVDDVLERNMQGIGHKLLVLSGKGGVGKSTVAVNLAVALAGTGARTGLLDADLHGPSIPVLMGLTGERPRMEGSRIQPVVTKGGLEVLSIGMLLGSGDEAIIWRGPLKYSAIRQLLRDVDWGELDYLVVDSPPGTGDEPLSVAQLVGTPASAVIVTTPQSVAVSDVRRCVTFCSRLSLDIAGVVENMSGLTCPHCGEQIELFSSGGGRSLALEKGIPFLGRIPLDPAVVASGELGRPFMQGGDDTPSSRAFMEVVQAIVDKSGNPGRGKAPGSGMESSA